MKSQLIYSDGNFTVLKYGHKLQTCHANRSYYEPIKSVLETKDYIFVTYKEDILSYHKTSKYYICADNIAKYSIATYGPYLYKLYHIIQPNIHKYHVIETTTNKYIVHSYSTLCDTIEDLVHQYKGNNHKIDPAEIIYPTILYDCLWPSYEINKSAYCDICVSCKK